MVHRAHESSKRANGDAATAQSLGPYRLPSQIFPTPDFLSRIRPGMVELLTSFDCAKSVKSDVWNFAVEVSILRTAGLGENELRWLMFMNYVDHAQEVTRSKDDDRQFRQTGNLTFAKRTCFVLTEIGVSFARTVLGEVPGPTSISPVTATVEPDNAVEQVVPNWDGQRRELRMNGRVIKRFRWSAKNQEIILATFQEEGWLYRIDDPDFPRSQPQVDQKQRLRDAVRALNKNQETSLIRFRGDGSGQGVVWEFVEGAEP